MNNNMKYQIETTVKRKFYVSFTAPNKLTADKVMDQLEEHMKYHDDPYHFSPSIRKGDQYLNFTIQVKSEIDSKSTGEPYSMEADDIEIRKEVEWWNGNLGIFEIYDKLKDEYCSSDQRKLIKYAMEYFYSCRELQGQLQDMADILGIDLDDDEGGEE